MFYLEDLPLENFIVVGSRALNIRESDDIDVLIHSKDIYVDKSRLNTKNELIYTFQFRGIRVECLLVDNNKTLSRILEIELNRMGHGSNLLASYHTLALLKVGHLSIPSYKWETHMNDYQSVSKFSEMAQQATGNMWPYDTHYEYYELERLHVRDTRSRYNKTKPISLKGRNAKDFFDDGVMKYVHHDTLHKWMSLEGTPMYTKMQKPGSEVECDYDLFKEMSFEEQLNCVIEESKVIACERFLIPSIMSGWIISPHDFRYKDVREAYKKALIKVCTTLTSGWFRDFAIKHYMEALNFAEMDYHLNIRVDELDKDYNLKLRDEESISN